jgi:putative transposase
MARPRRIFIPGTTQHLIQRGNNRADIFRGPQDYDVFLCTLRAASVRFGMDIHGYALMTNHVHLIVTGATPRAVPAAMQAIGRRYVPYFNSRYGRTGTLFEGRYRSMVVANDAYWFSCLRYVELNPIRARIVTTAETYRWSSYRAHALGTPNVLLTEHPLYEQLADTREARSRQWKEFCGIGTPPAELTEIRDAITRGRSLSTLVLPERTASFVTQP